MREISLQYQCSFWARIVNTIVLEKRLIFTIINAMLSFWAGTIFLGKKIQIHVHRAKYAMSKKFKVKFRLSALHLHHHLSSYCHCHGHHSSHHGHHSSHHGHYFSHHGHHHIGAHLRSARMFERLASLITLFLSRASL